MQILTLYPGMPAEVVEKDITSRMERWTGQSPGISGSVPAMASVTDGETHHHHRSFIAGTAI